MIPLLLVVLMQAAPQPKILTAPGIMFYHCRDGSTIAARIGEDPCQAPVKTTKAVPAEKQWVERLSGSGAGGRFVPIGTINGRDIFNIMIEQRYPDANPRPNATLKCLFVNGWEPCPCMPEQP